MLDRLTVDENDRGRGSQCKQIQRQPWKSGTYGVRPLASDLLFFRDTGHAEDVFGLLRLDDVDRVVEGNPSQEPPFTIADRHADQVVSGKGVPHVFLVHVGQDRYGDLLRDV